MIPIAYNVRSLLVRRTTTLATLLGIALAVAVLAVALMLTSGITKTLGASGSPNHAIVLRKGSDAELQSSVGIQSIGLILDQPGVKKDSQGRPIGAGEIVVVIAQEKEGVKGALSNVSVRGVTEMAMALRPEVRIVEGRPAKPGTDEVIIGSRIVGRFRGMEIGQSFELKKNRPVTVVGVFEAQGSSFESEVWADVETVRTSFGRDGVVSSVTVTLESESKQKGFETAVEHDKQLGLEVYPEPAYYEKQSEGMVMFFGMLGWVITVFFLLAAIIGAFITMNTAIAHRQREVGTMRALGFSRFAVLTSFVLEALFMSSAGAVVGVLIAFAATFIKFSMMNFSTWSEVVFSFTMTSQVVVTAIIFGVIMGLLGGLIPAIRAARLKPIDALRA